MLMRRLHVIPLLLFAALAVLWTFPLALHVRTHIPGDPGDNFSFLWNLWWMRRALDAADLSFFHSNYLFFPLGVDLVNHPHTALQGLLTATALRPLSIVEAENLYVLASVFANAAAAYALAFDITRRRRAAILAAVTFAGSPYIAAHLRGHFDLLSAWVLPLFALCFRRALATGAATATIGAGLTLAAAAWTAYYYVVYIGLFALTYLAALWKPLAFAMERRQPSFGKSLLRGVLLAVLCADAALLLWIIAAGGGRLDFAGMTVSVRTAQNPMTIAWLALGLLALTRWRVRLHVRLPSTDVVARGTRALAWTLIVFIVCASPLIYEAIALGLESGYVTQPYFWRAGPRGIDLVALISGNPFHPLTKDLTGAIYRAVNADAIEAVAWLGVVPLAILLGTRRVWSAAGEARCWLAVLGVSIVWALGPRLVVAGMDLGLPLPQLLARFVPIVSNARMPGRAMVLVYLSLGVLLALRLEALDGRWRKAAMQWLLVALVVFDGLGSPLPLTSLDQPLVYQRLAAIGDGGPVCEVPFGIGDGLTGVGSQAREALYYATIHGHPVVGGFIGRMPPGADDTYARMPVVGNLLRLSNGEPALPDPRGNPSSPCRYLVVNTATASADLVAYVHSALNLQLLAEDSGRMLYEVRNPSP